MQCCYTPSDYATTITLNWDRILLLHMGAKNTIAGNNQPKSIKNLTLAVLQKKRKTKKVSLVIVNLFLRRACRKICSRVQQEDKVC